MNDRFYNSRTWRRVSKAFMQSKRYICERCGGAGEVVHHKIYLDRWNVSDPEIAYNWENLECLCLACHNVEHGGGGSATAVDIRFDSAGNVVHTPHTPPKNDRD
mgnify:CR=1 FL=1